MHGVTAVHSLHIIMTTKVDLFAEIITDPSDLMDHNESEDLNLRILNTLSGNSLLCVVMEESVDSFLVALPCKLMSYGEKRVIETYLPVKFVRFFKPTLLAAIPMFGEFEQFYIKWLLENGNNLFPDFIEEEAVGLLQKRYDDIINQTQKLKDSLEGIASKETEPMAAIPTPSSVTKH